MSRQVRPALCASEISHVLPSPFSSLGIYRCAPPIAPGSRTRRFCCVNATGSWNITAQPKH